jgi:hypothetical protein
VTAAAAGLTVVLGLQMLALNPAPFGVAAGAVLLAVISMAWGCLLRRPHAITLSTAILLVTYALTVAGKPASSAAVIAVPAVAAATFLTAQLGWWAVDLWTPAHEDSAALWHRVGRLGIGAVISGVIAEAVVRASQLHTGRNLALECVGILAIIVLVGLCVPLAANRGPGLALKLERSPIAPRMHEERAKVGTWRRQAIRWIALVFDRLEGTPDTLREVRVPSSVSARTGVAALLLLLDVLGVGLAIGSGYRIGVVGEPESAVNIAPIIAAGLVIAGAVIVGWLDLLLVDLANPPASATSQDLSDRSESGPIAELDRIGVACRDALEHSRGSGALDSLLTFVSAALSNSLVVGDMRPPAAEPVEGQDKLAGLQDFLVDHALDRRERSSGSAQTSGHGRLPGDLEERISALERLGGV